MEFDSDEEPFCAKCAKHPIVIIIEFDLWDLWFLWNFTQMMTHMNESGKRRCQNKPTSFKTVTWASTYSQLPLSIFQHAAVVAQKPALSLLVSAKNLANGDELKKLNVKICTILQGFQRNWLCSSVYRNRGENNSIPRKWRFWLKIFINLPWTQHILHKRETDTVRELRFPSLHRYQSLPIYIWACLTACLQADCSRFENAPE